MKSIVLYATDTMADWEYGYLTAGIALGHNAGAPYELVVAGETAAEITTAGGLHVRPDTTIDDLELNSTALLVLPGGYTWGEGHDCVLDLAEKLATADIPVAAICGATIGLARRGLLDDRRHTSNSPDFLQAVPNYAGSSRYVDDPVVIDGGLITAPGHRPVEFARAIFDHLTVLEPLTADAWHRLYAGGDSDAFGEYIAAVS